MGASIGVFIMSLEYYHVYFIQPAFYFFSSNTISFFKILHQQQCASYCLFYFFFNQGIPVCALPRVDTKCRDHFFNAWLFSRTDFHSRHVVLLFFSCRSNNIPNHTPLFNNAKSYIAQLQPQQASVAPYALIRSEWFLVSFARAKRCRDVSHYSDELMEKIFKRHHFAAVICIIIAYLFLIIIGFFLDYKAFQIPAAAVITLFFAILIGVSGAFTYFFQSWSVPALIFFLLVLNFLYKGEWIDPRNKAYGLTYENKERRPHYSAVT